MNKQNRSKSIYVGNLSYRRDEKGIKYLFSKYGKVQNIYIAKDGKSKKNLGYAFVQMDNHESSIKAIEGLNESEIDGRKLKVSLAKSDSNFQFTSSKAKSSKAEKTQEIKKSKRLNSKVGLQALFQNTK